MHKSDFLPFCELIDATYDLIGSGANKTISVTAKGLFFASLSRFSLEDVKAALSAHCVDPVRGRFTPKPADVIEQIDGMAAKDGRPAGDEAWAIALTSRDEADTVVWTQEIAEAFATCAPVFPDQIGARKAFLEVYNRLVADARSRRQPATWSASLGWDMRKREAAVTKAGAAGLLSAPTVAALLPAPEPQATSDRHAQEQIARIREMMAAMQSEKTREIALHAQRERDATAGAKLREQEKFNRYRRDL